jgi:hypothetical protein
MILATASTSSPICSDSMDTPSAGPDLVSLKEDGALPSCLTLMGIATIAGIIFPQMSCSAAWPTGQTFTAPPVLSFYKRRSGCRSRTRAWWGSADSTDGMDTSVGFPLAIPAQRPHSRRRMRVS